MSVLPYMAKDATEKDAGSGDFSDCAQRAYSNTVLIKEASEDGEKCSHRLKNANSTYEGQG